MLLRDSLSSWPEQGDAWAIAARAAAQARRHVHGDPCINRAAADAHAAVLRGAVRQLRRAAECLAVGLKVPCHADRTSPGEQEEGGPDTMGKEGRQQSFPSVGEGGDVEGGGGVLSAAWGISSSPVLAGELIRAQGDSGSVGPRGAAFRLRMEELLGMVTGGVAGDMDMDSDTGSRSLAASSAGVRCLGWVCLASIGEWVAGMRADELLRLGDHAGA